MSSLMTFIDHTSCLLTCCHIDLLTCWHIVMLTSWYIDMLTYYHVDIMSCLHCHIDIVMLTSRYIDILSFWFVDMFIGWHLDILIYCHLDILIILTYWLIDISYRHGDIWQGHPETRQKEGLAVVDITCNIACVRNWMLCNIVLLFLRVSLLLQRVWYSIFMLFYQRCHRYFILISKELCLKIKLTINT